MDFLFYIALFVIAYLYSSIGHGGASGYISIMVLFSITPEFIKISALTMNVIVSAIAFMSFYKAGHFRSSLIWPFLITSIPAAYIGAKLQVSPLVFNVILLTFLVVAAIRLFFESGNNGKEFRPVNIPMFMIIGGVLGLFSGIAGIGGGILLTPILVLFNWADIKQSAAVSALFILANSLSGIAGLSITGLHYPNNFLLWLSLVVGGALLGAYFGSFKFNTKVLRIFLAIILLIASVKLFV